MKKALMILLICSDILSATFVLSWFLFFDNKLAPTDDSYIYAILIMFYHLIAIQITRVAEEKGFIAESIYKKIVVFRIIEAVIFCVVFFSQPNFIVPSEVTNDIVMRYDVPAKLRDKSGYRK